MIMRKAFTLIEVLVVLTIIAVLSGMLMPVVTIAQKRAKKTNTQSLLRKVETGLELFRGEMDAYPYQFHAVGDPFPSADNRLAWTIGHDMTGIERNDLNDDLLAARLAYGPSGAHAVTAAIVDPAFYAGYTGDTGAIGDHKNMGAGMVNRMGAERACLAVIAGNTQVTGLRGKTGMSIVAAPASRGFARDYLAFDLNRKNVRGDAIIDLYGKELIYVCPVIKGMRPVHVAEAKTKNQWYGSPDKPIDVVYYSLDTQGRAATISMASDIRTTAAASYIHGYELWSAGPDGRVDPIRNGSSNPDNISAQDFNRGLK